MALQGNKYGNDEILLGSYDNRTPADLSEEGIGFEH
jgi:hypothetical protein